MQIFSSNMDIMIWNNAKCFEEKTLFVKSGTTAKQICIFIYNYFPFSTLLLYVFGSYFMYVKQCILLLFMYLIMLIHFVMFTYFVMFIYLIMLIYFVMFMCFVMFMYFVNSGDAVCYLLLYTLVSKMFFFI